MSSQPQHRRRSELHGRRPRQARPRRAPRSLTVLFFFCLSLAGADALFRAYAANLADYQERVHAATVALDTLAAIDEEESEEDYAAKASATVGDVKGLLPARERVEWQGEAFDADNRWLHEALDSYEKNRTASAEERRAALARITERLSAIRDRLDEINPTAARLLQQQSEGQSNAERKAQPTRIERERLENILKRPGYANQTDAQKKSALERYAQRFREWVRKAFPESRPIQAGQSPRASQAAQIFVYALMLAIVAFILWRYRGLLRWRGLPTGLGLKKSRVVLGEQLAPDETPADLLDAAEQLARTGDLRGAIRKAYIALLVELGERRILRLAQHKTNRDYLQTLRRERAPLYESVAPLTMNFEKHWYGRAEAQSSDWTDFRNGCRKAIEGSSREAIAGSR